MEPTKQVETHQPPMPKKTKDKYGLAIKDLPLDDGKSSIVIDFDDRTKVLEHCKYNYKDRVYVTRQLKLEDESFELRLYRTK